MVDAITAKDLLSIEAYTFATNRNMLATFEILMAILSLLARFLSSSWQR